MKALKISEIDKIVEHMQWAVGARVQKVFVSERDICLQLYKDRDLQSLHFDMNPKAPFLILSRTPPVQPSKKTTPALLFLRSHFLGKTIQSVHRDEKLGRVVEIHFADESDIGLQIEVRLLPHGQNVLLSAGNKSISVFKPQELKEFIGGATIVEESIRSVVELEAEWINSRRSSSSNLQKTKAGKASKAQRIIKLEKSIAQVEDNIRSQSESLWEEAGKALLELQNVKEAFVQFPDQVNEDWNLAENIEHCFEQHKKNQSKILGSKKRLDELLAEKRRLEKMSEEDFARESVITPSPPRPQLKKSDTKSVIRARKTVVDDRFEVWVGKSAKDNLALLRKARAWDFWMHLKDHPGAHAIVFRNKNELVGDSVLKQAAEFLVQMSADKGLGLREGDTFAILVAEVRHVHPIKGDQIGRVTVREARTLSVRYHSKNATRK